MKIQLTRNRIYQILFGICVAVTYLNIYELTFAVWAAVFAFTIRRKYSLTVVKYVLCFAAIFVIAWISSLFGEYTEYNFFRDISYMVKPILGILVGYQLCRNVDIKPFRMIMYTGLVVAALHLGIILFSMVVYRISNIHELRHYTGYFGDFEVYALLVACFPSKLGFEISRKKMWLYIAILGFSSFLYLSRANFIQFAILFLAMKGYMQLTKRALVVIGALILFAGIGYAIIYNMHFTRNGKGLEGLMYKIQNAPIEAFATKINKNDWQDFNDNYRSFENIITVRQVSSHGTNAVLFGEGLGATIDLGRKLYTNDGEFIRYLPTLHNGFMTVLLKAGLLGVLLYLLFLYYLSKNGYSRNPIVQNINYFLSGTAVYMLLATWVLLGLYLKIDNKALIIGLVIGYKELLIRNQKTVEPT